MNFLQNVFLLLFGFGRQREGVDEKPVKAMYMQENEAPTKEEMLAILDRVEELGKKVGCPQPNSYSTMNSVHVLNTKWTIKWSRM